MGKKFIVEDENKICPRCFKKVSLDTQVCPNCLYIFDTDITQYEDLESSDKNLKPLNS
jgi:predicted amidophosphoribosyltransferase